MSTTEARAPDGSPARRGSRRGGRPARRIGSRLGDLLLTLASIGGVICILAVLAALIFKVTLIMFSTGSMAPTIPTGSVAVVRQIPAAAVDVGDVVTVDRPGQLPVTHRVRAIEPGPGAVRVLTLRGDANDQDDAVTYPVSTVRLVLFSVPKLAALIVSLSDPLVLGGITVLMAGLVMWAFWPRRRAGEPDADDDDRENPAGVGNVRENPGGQDVPDGIAHSDDRDREDISPADRESGGGRHRAVAATGVVALGLLMASATVVGAPPAHATTVERVIEGSVLRLITIGDDTAMTQLQPGVPVVWQVGVTTRTVEPGTIDLAMRVSGALATSPTGLQMRMSTCDTRWAAGRCAAGELAVIAPGPAERYANRSYSFGTMPTGQERWVLVTAWLPARSTAQGRSATVTVAANGVGESIAAQPGVPGPVLPLPEPVAPLPDPGVSLPNTGIGVGVRMALFAGLVALAAGLILLGAGRRRSRETLCAA